jgi:hypothetical protein
LGRRSRPHLGGHRICPATSLDTLGEAIGQSVTLGKPTARSFLALASGPTSSGFARGPNYGPVREILGLFRRGLCRLESCAINEGKTVVLSCTEEPAGTWEQLRHYGGLCPPGPPGFSAFSRGQGGRRHLLPLVGGTQNAAPPGLPSGWDLERAAPRRRAAPCPRWISALGSHPCVALSLLTSSSILGRVAENVRAEPSRSNLNQCYTVNHQTYRPGRGDPFNVCAGPPLQVSLLRLLLSIREAEYTAATLRQRTSTGKERRRRLRFPLHTDLKYEALRKHETAAINGIGQVQDMRVRRWRSLLTDPFR